MKATEQLKEEHEGIKLMLSIMIKMTEANTINTEHLGKAIDFIKVFADKCHHGKEEDILFPELEKAGMSRENGPIAVMLYEHTEGREFIKGLTEAYEKYKNGDASALPAIRENTCGYVNLLRNHIEKENNVLFMMADRYFGEQKQEEIAVAFEKIEAERIGAGKHEEYHKLLKELKKVYL
jgi:hemerythrin-like domain-containing protein